MVLSLSVGLIGPRKFGGITNSALCIDRGQADIVTLKFMAHCYKEKKLCPGLGFEPASY